ncbi:MAG: cysteine--tRNA ligase [Xanthomonadales bacterium]|nr:cysteine--tRNA ligase [Xanthomonadales bacterium]
MQLKLFNSLSRQLEVFHPLDPARVTLYVCGPTVYNYIHIGNARPAVVFGLLARLLRRLYPGVVYARNITDVDDKINAAAAAQGVPIQSITQRFTGAYREDMAALGVDPPDVEPEATAHIDQIIAMCETLIEAGHAYVAEGHVLFDVGSYADYGALSRRSTDEMLAGARVDVAPYKRSPGDFVLWKPSSDDLPGWDSPWGRGRPGWHIECSAMAATHLGETIDIHAGGIDLQFPHHENEIAQSTCAHGGRVFARYWLHNGLLNLGGRKMSKSLGNITLVHELLQHHPAEALRYALLGAQYRQPLDWSDDAVDRATKTLDRLYGTLRDLAAVSASDEPVPEAVMAALCDDLNTPDALAALAGLAARARKASDAGERAALKGQLLAAGELLGLLQDQPAQWFRRGRSSQTPAEATSDGSAGTLSDSDIDALVAERDAARKSRDFARSDAIRDQLAGIGVLVEDGADGGRWRWQR